ncbi:hypothetical protein T310_4272 [Rasamsonia emersonii CBS 393.64]|uniref:Uncharacterized protein n=1 Tax=Rasamsonia emersonii (strain ATCC 16479 / CBS 393.64 / IMI 116815) TaxID=1408163 RepID=A0A0F4YV85_RASE3|nr:hypothetical protein T310_4272 [Rasamsonia emersonii CBS 393.64]KKA21751.1 hypothetical protein T310_4272 [Rasamsonia emersonii CBS 393.64]
MGPGACQLVSGHFCSVQASAGLCLDRSWSNAWSSRAARLRRWIVPPDGLSQTEPRGTDTESCILARPWNLTRASRQACRLSGIQAARATYGNDTTNEIKNDSIQEKATVVYHRNDKIADQTNGTILTREEC